MSWLNEPVGTVTEWAVEFTYDDGEKRYSSDGYDEAEARREAEVSVLNHQYSETAGGSYPVSARAVSRQVTYGERR